MKWLSGFAICLLLAASVLGQAGDFAPSQTASNPLQLRIADGSIGGGILGTFQFKATNVLLTASTTNFIYLDLSQSPPVLNVNTTGFPTTQVYKIATIVTSATQITSLTDNRPALNLNLPGGGGTNNALPGCNVLTTTCGTAATTAAVADWRQAATDGTCTNSSANISWGTPNEITTADVGKTIDMTASGIWLNNGVKTTIASVTSSTTGTISAAAAGANCGAGNITFFVYTDNAAAFNTVELAIHNSPSKAGIIWYPCGVYGVASAIWNQSGAGDSINYFGGGGGHAATAVTGCTIFKVSPAVLAVVSGSGLFAMIPANGDTRDIVLDGEGITSTATNSGLIQWSGATDLENFQARNFAGTAGSPTLCHINSDVFSGRNVTCDMKNGKGMVCNSLSAHVFNGQFSGTPGLELADCSGTFVAGVVGVDGTAASNAMTSVSGSGAVGVDFFGTVLQGTSAASATVAITKPSGNPVTVNLNGTLFDCRNTSNVAMLSIGAGAVVKLNGQGIDNALSTIGCPGTPTITNNGTFIDAGGNSFGSANMTNSWSGAGSYFLTCISFQAAPTISTHFNTSADSVSGSSPCSFIVTVGTGVGTSTGAVTLPVAPTGWNCWAQNQNRAATVLQTGNTTTTATFTNFGTTFAATNWTNSDTLLVNCNPR